MNGPASSSASPPCPTPSLMVFDHWVGDRGLLDALKETVQIDYETKHGEPQATRFNWWDGRSPAGDLAIHRYISMTYERLKPLFGLDCEGFEWWGNYNSSVGWHYDKDEVLFEREKKLVHPRIGTVLYLTGTDVIEGAGGAFAINSDASGKTADQVFPVVDRLLVFRGDRLHCNRHYTGRRSGLAVNFWECGPQAFSGKAALPNR